MFMKLAFDIANKSKAKRLKVGAVLVDGANKIIGTGKNHIPDVYGDDCEYTNDKGELVTRDELIHAEEDAICYAAKCGCRTKGATIYVTDSPCLSCAKLIYSAGIEKVVYCRPYRLTLGLDFLRSVDIEVEQLIVEL